MESLSSVCENAEMKSIRVIELAGGGGRVEKSNCLK